MNISPIKKIAVTLTLAVLVGAPSFAQASAGRNTFVMESGGIVDDDLTVMMDKKMSGSQQAKIKDDQKLTVTGKLRKMTVVDAERMFGEILPEVKAKWKDTKHVLVADKIIARRD